MNEPVIDDVPMKEFLEHVKYVYQNSICKYSASDRTYESELFYVLIPQMIKRLGQAADLSCVPREILQRIDRLEAVTMLMKSGVEAAVRSAGLEYKETK